MDRSNSNNTTLSESLSQDLNQDPQGQLQLFLLQAPSRAVRDSWIKLYQALSLQKIGVKLYKYSESGQVSIEVLSQAEDIDKDAWWHPEQYQYGRRRSDIPVKAKRKSWSGRSISEGEVLKEELNNIKSKSQEFEMLRAASEAMKNIPAIHPILLESRVDSITDTKLSPKTMSSLSTSSKFSSIKSTEFKFPDLDSQLGKEYGNEVEFQRRHSEQRQILAGLKHEAIHLMSFTDGPLPEKSALKQAIDEMKQALEKIENQIQGQSSGIDSFHHSLVDLERERNSLYQLTNNSFKRSEENVSLVDASSSGSEDLSQSFEKTEKKVDILDAVSRQLEKTISATQTSLEGIELILVKLRKLCMEYLQYMPTCLTRLKRLEIELKACSAESSELDQELKRLQMKHEGEKEFVDEWKRRVKEQESELEVVNQSLAEAKQSLLLLRDHFERAESDVKRLKPLERLVQTLKQETEKSRLEKLTIQFSLDASIREKENLLNEIKQLETEMEKVSNLEAKIEALQLKDNQHEVDMYNLRQECYMKDQTSKLLESSLQETKAELNFTLEGYREMEQKYTRLSERLDAFTTVDEQFAELRNDFKNLKWKSEELRKEKEEKERLLLHLSEENENINQAMAIIQDICSKADTNSSSQKQGTNAKSFIHTVVDHVKHLSTYVSELQEQLARDEERLRVYDRLYETGKTELQKTATAFQELECKYELKVSQQYEEIESLQSQLDDNKQQLSFLKAELQNVQDDVHNQITLQKDYMEKYQHALSNLSTLRATHQELLNAHQDINSENQELSQQTKQLETEKLHISRTLSIINSEYEQLKEEYENLKKEHQKLTLDHVEVKTNLGQLQADAHNLKDTLHQLQVSHNQTMSDLSSLTEEHKLLNIDYTTLKSLSQQLQADRQKLETTITSLCSQNRELMHQFNKELSGEGTQNLSSSMSETSGSNTFHAKVYEEIKALEESQKQIGKFFILSAMDKEHMKKELMLLQEMKKQLENSQEKLMARLEEAAQENEALRESNISVTKKLEQLHEGFQIREKGLEAEMSKMKDAYEAELMSKDRKYADLEENIRAFNKLHAVVERDYQALSQKKQVTEDVLAEMSRSYKDLERAFADLTRSHESSEDERKRLVQEVTKNEQSSHLYQSLLVQQSNLEKEYKETLKKYTEISSLFNGMCEEKKDQEEKIKSLHFKIGELTIGKEELLTEHRKLIKENKQLRSNSLYFSKLLDDTQQRFFVIQQEKENGSEKIQRLKEINTQYFKELRNLEENIEIKNQELSKVCTQLKSTSNTLKTKETLLQELEERLRDTKLVFAERFALKSSVQDLQSELAEANNQIKKLHSDKQDLEKAVEILSTKLKSRSRDLLIDERRLTKSESADRLANAVSILTERKRALQKTLLEPNELSEVVKIITSNGSRP
jgi:chromosome segregation ATPase